MLKLNAIPFREQKKILEDSGLFDASYYLKENKDVAQSGVDPLTHFIQHGWKEYRCPSEDFSTRFYLNSYPEVIGSNPLLHFVITGAKEGRFSQMPAEEKIRLRLRKSGLFDIEYYRDQAKSYDLSKVRPIDHFLNEGYKAGLRPSPMFDPAKYRKLVPELGEDQNPVLHYIDQGIRKGVRVSGELGEHRLPAFPFQQEKTSSMKRRICLFAAYDPDGVVDPYVIFYLKQLSKYADVFYLSSALMGEKELVKIRSFTKKCWAIEHRLYDFGSYAMLAKELVGWQTICRYEEIILANDSCYCVDSFEMLFHKMDQSTADFWGIQSTIHPRYPKIYYSLRHRSPKMILWRDIKNSDFHLGSYFLAVRNFNGAFLVIKEMLADIEECTSKRQIVQRYEVGMTQKLLKHGYKMDSFIEEIYPFHPAYSLNAFRILAKGSPLLKTGIVKTNTVENSSYSIPLLYRWQAFLNIRSPEFDHDLIIDHLKRVGGMSDCFPEQSPKAYCLSHDIVEDIGAVSYPWEDMWKHVEKKKTGIKPQRVCLFAGQNSKGGIVPKVAEYIKKLAEFSDVYFLSSTPVNEAELEKIAGSTLGTWCFPHEKNDFGSYSELAKYFVGWPCIEKYDELLLVNDNCCFFHSFDTLFDDMEKNENMKADFWGVRGCSTSGFYIQSHFICFNQKIIHDYSFRSFLDNIIVQPSKNAVNVNYEISLSKNLIDWGYRPWFIAEDVQSKIE